MINAGELLFALAYQIMSNARNHFSFGFIFPLLFCGGVVPLSLIANEKPFHPNENMPLILLSKL
jgi:hypothetical protein